MARKQKISSQDVQKMVNLLEQFRSKSQSTEDKQTLTIVIIQLKKLLVQTNPCIGKKQLAAQYQLSLRAFINLLRQDEECYDELILAGYNKRQKLFTPRQIEIINQHFG